MNWWLRLLALVLVLMLLLMAVLLPHGTLVALRVNYPWFDFAIVWVEGLCPAVDMVHVVLFAVVGLFGRLVFPRQPLWVLVRWLLAFAAASELVQFLVPGREPRWSDLAMDFVGSLLGLLVATALVGLVRWLAPPRRKGRLPSPADVSPATGGPPDER